MAPPIGGLLRGDILRAFPPNLLLPCESPLAPIAGPSAATTPPDFLLLVHVVETWAAGAAVAASANDMAWRAGVRACGELECGVLAYVRWYYHVHAR